MADPNCKDCKGSGRILLLNKSVDCDCIKDVIKEIYDIAKDNDSPTKDGDGFYGANCTDCI